MAETPSRDYLVYWAKLENHSDPFSEGYIGITCDLAERKRSHKKNKNNQHFANALRKYEGKIEWTVLFSGLTKEEALKKEGEYRPLVNIGWNSIAGGSLGVAPEWYLNEENRAKHRANTSLATKLRIAQADSTEARSARAKMVWENEEYRVSREGLLAGENNSQYGKFGAEHPAAGHKKTEAGLKAISDAHKGKTLSEETRRKISQARIKKFAAQKEARMRRLAEEKELKKLEREKAKAEGKYLGENAGPSKITDEERKEICRRRAAGDTYSAIALDYPLRLTGVRAVCKTWGPQNGFPFANQIGRGELKKVISDDQKKQICEAYANGESPRSLASMHDLSESMIYKYLKDWGPDNGIPYIKRRKYRTI